MRVSHSMPKKNIKSLWPETCITTSGSNFLSQWVSLFLNGPQTLWFSLPSCISPKTRVGVVEIYDRMKQPYICVCSPACVINVPECVCFELSIQRGGKKYDLACRQQTDNRKDVMQAFQLSSLIYSRPWSFLQHIHTSHCLCCQLPSVAQNRRRVLLFAASSAEQGLPATFPTSLNQTDWKVTFGSSFLFCFFPRIILSYLFITFRVFLFFFAWLCL